ncbi:tetratricopeptide repeat protein [Alkalihalobacillus sp. R86527]|uniref:tetratricopeptide repeat protein n=1 Tax=Alkalihalobacillus sp. R86527 TaxID=3093863 RepID=UPI00366D5BA0
MPLRIRDKTLEELEELEQSYKEKLLVDDIEYSYHYEYISILEGIYQRVRRNREDSDYATYVKNRIIQFLIHYGTYLKTIYQKDDSTARRSLEKVLSYDRTSPIAHYRLGFLAYKHQNYSMAVTHFNASLENTSHYNNQYALTEQQLYYAHLYLTNSSLYIAASTHQSMKELQTNQGTLLGVELSSLYEVIDQGEQYLRNNAFYKIDSELEVSTCSKEQCEELAHTSSAKRIVLYFNDRCNEFIYDNHSTELSEQQAVMLRHFILKSSMEKPITRSGLSVVSHLTEEMKKNTYSKKMQRLNDKLEGCGITRVIQTTSLHGEPAYYFDKSLPYTILFRVDDNAADEYIPR